MVLLDQYPGTNSRVFIKFLKGKNLQIVFTALDAPLSNGLSDRLNQSFLVQCVAK